jgi:hypothetical protein
MARTDDEWVQDIISAIADIRTDTTGLDFAAFDLHPDSSVDPLLCGLAAFCCRYSEYLPRIGMLETQDFRNEARRS